MDKIKAFLKDRKWEIVRFLIIFLIAIWINTKIISDLKTPTDDIERLVENNETFIDIGYFDLQQNDFSSGDLNSILWKIIYLGGGKDKLCVDVDEIPKNVSLYVNFNQNYDRVLKDSCFSIEKNQSKITFNLRYIFNVSVPEIEPRIVNKTECVPETINVTSGKCLVRGPQDVLFIPRAEFYLEPNVFHKILKFIFIFFSTGAVLWAFSRTFYLIRYGWDKK